jgi:hypothetical protein
MRPEYSIVDTVRIVVSLEDGQRAEEPIGLRGYWHADTRRILTRDAGHRHQ